MWYDNKNDFKNNLKRRFCMSENMTEKDKMLAGELYDANYNEDLIKERTKAKDLCYEYNNLKPSEVTNIYELFK